MDGHPALIRKQITKMKPKLFSAQRITTSLPISLHNPCPHYEFAYVVRGSGKLITENSMYDFAENDLFIVDKNTKRGLFFDADGEIFSICIAFKTEKTIVENEITTLPGDRYFTSLKLLFEAAITESTCRGFVAKYLMENLLKCILLGVFRSSVPEATFSNKNRVFLTAKNYFDEHYLHLENIDTVCKNLKVNKFFITHMFKENLGMPPVKYLIEKRMTLAKKFLKETTLSISAVAAECGYSDVAYFCRIFKKTVGVTPLKFRRERRQRQQQSTPQQSTPQQSATE